MTLRNNFLDAIINGELGNGIVITRQEFMQFFSNENTMTTGCFLSNSEMVTGASHSQNYTHFTLRISEGRYRVHPGAIQFRMAQRGLL